MLEELRESFQAMLEEKWNIQTSFSDGKWVLDWGYAGDSIQSERGKNRRQ